MADRSKKVLVTGARGMLGREVMYALDEVGFEAIPLPTRLKEINWNHLYGFRTLINCAGAVPQKVKDPLTLIETNCLGPHQLASQAALAAGPYIIHVSTDCVFTAPGPHSELDTPSPNTPYGVSKLMGELTVPHLTVRTSFIGWAEHGLVHDVLFEPSIRASGNLLWSGHTARTVARVLAHLAQERPVGLLHIPGPATTRYELVLRLKYLLGARQLEIVKDDSFVADRRLRTLYPDAFPAMPSYDNEIEDLVKSIKNA